MDKQQLHMHCKRLTISSSDSVYASLRALDAAAEALFFSFLLMFFHARELKSMPSAQKTTSALLLREDLSPDAAHAAAAAVVNESVAISWQDALCNMPSAAKLARKSGACRAEGTGALAAPCKAKSRLEAGLNSVSAEACFFGGTGGRENEFFLLLRSRLNFLPGCGGGPCCLLCSCTFSLARDGMLGMTVSSCWCGGCASAANETTLPVALSCEGAAGWLVSSTVP